MLNNSLVGQQARLVVIETIQANYFIQTFRWKCVASSFYCVYSISKTSTAFLNTAIWGQCWPPRPSTDRWGTSTQEGEEGRENTEKHEK